MLEKNTLKKSNIKKNSLLIKNTLKSKIALIPFITFTMITGISSVSSSQALRSGTHPLHYESDWNDINRYELIMIYFIRGKKYIWCLLTLFL